MLRDFVNTTLDADEIGDLLTMAGFELEGIDEVEGQPVLDIKVVSNRGDGLSVFGLSREVLAKDANATPTSLYLQSAHRFEEFKPNDTDLRGVTVRVETPDCTRYACLVLSGIANGEAPEWLQQRIRQAGWRPISLLVDLTNYVMLELGQPLHAFDLKKLSGPTIVVRKARAGEKLTTLNGDEHQLRSDQMMICDAEKPVAAAGVMGGLETEVSAETTEVLLESAHFLNTSVRRTRKQLGLNTEASYRFERSVDPEGVVAALARFAELLEQIQPAVKVSGPIDIYPTPLKHEPVDLDVERGARLLGMPLTLDQSETYLTRLGFHVEHGPNLLRVSPPSWRPDIVREEDLIEELGRVHGYEKIPSVLPQGTTTQGGIFGLPAFIAKLRNGALRAGYSQTISHSLRDLHPLDKPFVERVGPRNPNSPDMALLRNSVLPSLAEAARRNGGKDLHLFEIGRVFVKQGTTYVEDVHLGLLSMGALQPPHWVKGASAEADYFSLKATIEDLGDFVGLQFSFAQAREPDPRFHPTQQSEIWLGDKAVGVMGTLHPDVAEESDVPPNAVAAELSPSAVFGQYQATVKLAPVSRNPSVRRDISLLLEKSVPYATVSEVIQNSIGDYLEKQWLFDVYEGEGIPAGKHSLSVALQLRKHGENFTDEEANRVREQAVQALSALGATTR